MEDPAIQIVQFEVVVTGDRELESFVNFLAQNGFDTTEELTIRPADSEPVRYHIISQRDIVSHFFKWRNSHAQSSAVSQVQP